MQKTCSLTGHVWDNYWILGNKRPSEAAAGRARWSRARSIARPDERADIAKLSESLRQELTERGSSSSKSTGPHSASAGEDELLRGLESKFGEEAWAHLEKVAGKLV